MPFDAQAQRESAELGAEGADTRAALAASYANAQSKLGFGAGATNPYGATEENKTQLENAQRGVANTAGNSLYAGSTLNAQSQARRAYDKAQTRTAEEINTAQNENTGGVTATTRDVALGEAGIKEGSIKRAEATEPAPLGVGRGRGRGRVRKAPTSRRRVVGRGARGRIL